MFFENLITGSEQILSDQQIQQQQEIIDEAKSTSASRVFARFNPGVGLGKKSKYLYDM